MASGRSGMLAITLPPMSIPGPAGAVTTRNVLAGCVAPAYPSAGLSELVLADAAARTWGSQPWDHGPAESAHTSIARCADVCHQSMGGSYESQLQNDGSGACERRSWARGDAARYRNGLGARYGSRTRHHRTSRWLDLSGEGTRWRRAKGDARRQPADRRRGQGIAFGHQAGLVRGCHGDAAG